jgi:hypothetical protein
MLAAVVRQLLIWVSSAKEFVINDNIAQIYKSLNLPNRMDLYF